jgi:hypothetical protein
MPHGLLPAICTLIMSHVVGLHQALPTDEGPQLRPPRVLLNAACQHASQGTNGTENWTTGVLVAQVPHPLCTSECTLTIWHHVNSKQRRAAAAATFRVVMMMVVLMKTVTVENMPAGSTANCRSPPLWIISDSTIRESLPAHETGQGRRNCCSTDLAVAAEQQKWHSTYQRD